MAELVGEFPVDLTSSEFPLLPPELSYDMTSLSGLAGNLGFAAGPSVGHVRFEFLWLPPMAAGVAVLGAAVLVNAWAKWADLALAGKAGHPNPSVRTLGENSGASR